MINAVRFAAAYAALTASHHLGDMWVQRDADALDKGKPGWEGHAACLRHVGSYTATQALALWAADRYLGLGLNPHRAAAALAVSAVTHYYADRSGGHWQDPEPAGLVAVAHRLGKQGWLKADPRAGFELDQAWHLGWIGIAAAVAAGRS
jgi:hypothetical protein